MSEKENILTKTYDLLLYLIPQLEKYPRSQKFLLGDRIETSLLDILENFIEAYYTERKFKLDILTKENIKLEKFRYLIRLSYNLKLISVKRYEFISQKINDIGIALGSWIKSLK